MGDGKPREGKRAAGRFKWSDGHDLVNCKSEPSTFLRRILVTFVAPRYNLQACRAPMAAGRPRAIELGGSPRGFIAPSLTFYRENGNRAFMFMAVRRSTSGGGGGREAVRAD